MVSRDLIPKPEITDVYLEKTYLGYILGLQYLWSTLLRESFRNSPSEKLHEAEKIFEREASAVIDQLPWRFNNYRKKSAIKKWLALGVYYKEFSSGRFKL